MKQYQYACCACMGKTLYVPCRLEVIKDNDASVDCPKYCPFSRGNSNWKLQSISDDPMPIPEDERVLVSEAQTKYPYKVASAAPVMAVPQEQQFCAALLGLPMDTIQRILDRYIHYRDNPKILQDVMVEWSKS